MWTFEKRGSRDEVVRALDHFRGNATSADDAQVDRVKQMLAQELTTWPAKDTVRLRISGKVGSIMEISVIAADPHEVKEADPAPKTKAAATAKPKAKGEAKGSKNK